MLNSPPENITACCIVVPDSRLWTPSTHTIMLIQQEKENLSVVFEEWIELCYQRQFILPPSYTRILLLAEYIRMSNGSSEYLKYVQETALIPGEDHIPITSNTRNIQSGAYRMSLAALFEYNSQLWSEGSAEFSRSPGGVDEALWSIFLSTLTLGSPYQMFRETDWLTYYSSELNILKGSQNMFLKMKGYWPSHPLSPYNIRTPGHMQCFGETIEDRRSTWIEELKSVIKEGM